MARFNMRTCQVAMLPCDIVGDSAGIVNSCGQHAAVAVTPGTALDCRVNEL